MSSIKVVNKGDIILKEKPFILLPTIESRKCGLCCSYCMKAIGDWKTQADMYLLRSINNNSIDDAIFDHQIELAYYSEINKTIVDPLIKENKAFGCINQQSYHFVDNTDITKANKEYACTELYCSVECRKTCWVKWHRLECSCSSISGIDNNNNLSKTTTNTTIYNSNNKDNIDKNDTYTVDSSEDRKVFDMNPNTTISIMDEFNHHVGQSNEIFYAVRRVITTLLCFCLNNNLDNMNSSIHPIVLNSKDVYHSNNTIITLVVQWFLQCFPPIISDNTTIDNITTTSSNNTDRSADNNKVRMNEYEQQYDLSDEAEESWYLLYSSLVTEKQISSSVFAPLLSKTFYTQVLFILNSHLHSLSIQIHSSDSSSGTSQSSPVMAHLLHYLMNRKDVVYRNNAPEEEYLYKLIRKTTNKEQQITAAMTTSEQKEVTNHDVVINDTLKLLSDLSNPLTSSDTMHIFPVSFKSIDNICMTLLVHISQHSKHSCLPNTAISSGSSSSNSSNTTNNNSRSNNSNNNDNNSIKDNIINASMIINDSLDWEQTLQAFISSRMNNLLHANDSISQLSSSNNDSSHIELETCLLPTIELIAIRSYLSSSLRSISYIDHCVIPMRDIDGISSYSFRSRWKQLNSHRDKNFNRKNHRNIKINHIKCICIRCVYEQYKTNKSLISNSILKDFPIIDIIELGNFYMQQFMYIDAREIYRYIACIIENEMKYNLNSSNIVSNNIEQYNLLQNQLGDVYHALGASYLEALQNLSDFETSRRFWEEGWKKVNHHRLLQHEIDKCHCYPIIKIKILTKQLSQRNDVGNIKYKIQGNSQILYDNNINITITKQLFKEKDYLILNKSKKSLDHKNTLFQIPSCICIEDHIYLTNGDETILSKEECSYLIEATEKYACIIGGWTTSRHYAVPTTDIPLHIIKHSDTSDHNSNILDWFNDVFKYRLAPLLASQFHKDMEGEYCTVVIHDAFIVKYEVKDNELDGDDTIRQQQTLLPLHKDQSSHSFIIALNNINEYEGGGTYFPDYHAILRPDLGQVLSFPGGIITHGGYPINSGIRYILAVFAYINTTKDQQDHLFSSIKTNRKNGLLDNNNYNNNLLDLINSKKPKLIDIFIEDNSCLISCTNVNNIDDNNINNTDNNNSNNNSNNNVQNVYDSDLVDSKNVFSFSFDLK